MESKSSDTQLSQTSSRVANLATREELERLLTLAEQLEEKRNHSANRNAFFQAVDTFMCVIIVGLPVLYGGTYITRYQFVPEYLKLSLLALPTLVATWYITLRAWRKRISMQALRDQFAMEDIVELLREVQPLIAQREGWSALDKAAFRIRIKRFDIAPTRPVKQDTTPPAQVQSSGFTVPAPNELRSSVKSAQNPPTVTLQNH